MARIEWRQQILDVAAAAGGQVAVRVEQAHRARRPASTTLDDATAGRRRGVTVRISHGGHPFAAGAQHRADR